MFANIDKTLKGDFPSLPSKIDSEFSVLDDKAHSHDIKGNLKTCLYNNIASLQILFFVKM